MRMTTQFNRSKNKSRSRHAVPGAVRHAVEQLESRTLFTGTFTALTNLAPAGIGTMYLMTDGTVMAQGGGGTSWYRLTPDVHGSYVNGTWTTLASMHDSRQYYSLQVLKDGRARAESVAVATLERVRTALGFLPAT